MEKIHIYIKEYLSGTGGYFSEKGFKYLGYYLYKLNFTWKQYLITVSFFKTFLYYKAIKNFSRFSQEFYFLIWVILFNVTFLYGQINIMRQSIATGLFLLVISKISTIKKYTYFILAYNFHKSILFFFPILINHIIKNIQKVILKKYIILKLFIILIILPYFFVWYRKFNYYFYYSHTNKSFYIKLIILIIFYIWYKKRKKSITIYL